MSLRVIKKKQIIIYLGEYGYICKMNARIKVLT